jgi:hypothetical protein
MDEALVIERVAFIGRHQPTAITSSLPSNGASSDASA